MPDSQQHTTHRVSVIVASCDTPGALARCLQSLAAQPAFEVIVADGSGEDPTAELQPRFPSVRFAHFARALSIPELRREGLRLATGEILALTESWMVPAPSWVALLEAAHREHPADPAIGGTVAFAGEAGPAAAFAWADYFTEYGFHLPGGPDGPCEALTGANVSYKRWAVEMCWDLFEQGRWEPFIHGFLERKGYRPRRVDRAVTVYFRSLRPLTVMRERFQHGRQFAAERGRDWAIGRRLARALGWPLAALALTRRLWREAARRPSLRRPFYRAAPWAMLFYGAWALGEAAGFLLGPGAKGRPTD